MKIENSPGSDKNRTSSTDNDGQPVDGSAETAVKLKSDLKNEDDGKSKEKSETKADSKDASKDEAKHEIKNEAKNEAKNDVKSSAKSDAKNNVKKVEVVQSSDQPASNPSDTNKPDTKSKSVMNKSKNNEEDYHEKLLRVLKKEVKQIMEEAVTKKVVNEESSSIISLCAAVDACLAHGLKRRALGLFKTNSTTALLQKCSKNCESASKVYKIVTELEKMLPKGSSSSDSLNKFRLSLSKQTNASSSTTNNLSNVGNLSHINGTGISATNTRYLWIRIALFEKHLYSIVEHLVANSTIYYEKEALVCDIVGGQILSDLLIGPCTLDYSKIKNQDHIFIDPHAEELVQRHNLISSPSSHGSPSCTSSPLTKTSSLRKAPLYLPYYKWFNFVNSSSSGSNETNSSLTQSVENHVDEFNGCGSPVHTSLAQRLSLNSPFSPKEYVESLHQNCKTTLLYGKNNVIVQPGDKGEALAGYLSLHHLQNSNSLEIRWTPNQLMKGKKGDKEVEQEDTSIYWDYALNIFVRETVYLHCHHNEQGGVAVFIGHDGVQKPSIRFPKGSHLLAFLTCLEAGLLPHGQLDPPLGIQKGKGKVFPLIKRKRAKHKGKSNKSKSGDKSEETENKTEDDESTNDYVFRIIFNSLKPDTISEEMFNPKSTNAGAQADNKQLPLWKPKGFRQKLISTSSNSSTNSSKSLNDDFNSLSASTTASSSSIQTVCETMKHQIISRAFYGWLAYTRHLKTVRTHLSALVNSEITNADDPSLYKGLTEQQFANLQDEQGRIKDVNHLFKCVYFGYCDPLLRRKVWPYLLGHYDFQLTKEQRDQQDEEMKQNYELLMTEWLAVEAIVKIRDKENLTASLAKFNSEEHRISNGQLKKGEKGDQLDDVFRENDSETARSTDESKAKRNSERSSNFLIEKMFNDVIEEDENCEDADAANENRDADSRCSSATLKRQRNVYTQSSTSQAPYATNQILITGASTDTGSLDLGKLPGCSGASKSVEEDADSSGQLGLARSNVDSRNDGQLSADHSTCVSPASSNGGVYTNELLDIFSLNIHRIEKDVQRCDRNYPFFMETKNLEKLRNIICTYVWKNLSNGYVQGMCDLVAPLLVILEDEMLTYSCFCELMKRMSANFPYSVAMNSMDNMDIHFANMRSLIQILDPELFELMRDNGDYTHFYFCYRWFLLDFKREFNYDDVFKVWEVIWASKTVASPNMVLFIALALVQQYRDIILENNMDFCEIIRFFNEFAEKHDVDSIVENARKLVFSIQSLIS